MTGAEGSGYWNRYVYDADGKRTRHVRYNNPEAWYVYGIDGELLAEYTAGASPASPQKEYGYRNGELLVTAEANGNVQWLVSDHLGTPRIILDQTGSLANVKRRDHLPFGEELGAGVGGRTTAQGYSSGSDNVRQGFTGYEKDGETGLNFAQSRYYSPTMGRFTSPDQPFNDQWEDDPQSWNLYSYVRNNPLVATDPTGQWIKRVIDGTTYYIAEKGDTFESLAELLNVSTRSLTDFFRGGPEGGTNIQIDEHFDISAFAAYRERGAVVADFFILTEDQIPGDRYSVDVGLPMPGGKIGGVMGSLARKGASTAKPVIPKVANSKLQNIVRDLFKGAKGKNPIGTGSTADAVREELRTGNPVGGRFHSQKAQQYIRALDNWLRNNPSAPHYDRVVAQSLRDDLASALAGK